MSLKPAFDNLGLLRLICYNYGFTVQLLSGSKIVLGPKRSEDAWIVIYTAILSSYNMARDKAHSYS